MNSTAIQEIRDRIEDFLAGLEELVTRAALESVQQALGSAALGGVSRDSAPTLASKGNRAVAPSAGGKAKRGKRTGEEVDALADKLLKYIAKHPGQRMEQISAGMNMSSKELTLPLQKLKNEKRLKTKGQKRATEYSAR